MPSSSAARMHSPLVSVICVDAWTARSGLTARNQPHEAEVLHEHGIDAGFGEPHDVLLDRCRAPRGRRAC